MQTPGLRPDLEALRQEGEQVFPSAQVTAVCSSLDVAQENDSASRTRESI